MTTTGRNAGFKRKTIEKIISQSMKKWLDNIAKTDAELAKKMHDDYIVTGGAIASMLQGELPNDFDVYFKTVDVAASVAEFYLKKINTKDGKDVSKDNLKVGLQEVHKHEDHVKIFVKSAGVLTSETKIEDYDYFEQTPLDKLETYMEKLNQNYSKEYEPVMVTSNAITINPNIQVILRFCGEPEVIHKNFDFIHTMNYYTKATGLVLKQDSLESIMAKELRYVGSLYPLCSIFRIRKFLERGWTISAGELTKIGFDISNLDMEDISILQEQLIGVDQAYFHQLIDDLKSGIGQGKQFTRSYLWELIDKVFDEEVPLPDIIGSSE